MAAMSPEKVVVTLPACHIHSKLAGKSNLRSRHTMHGCHASAVCAASIDTASACRRATYHCGSPRLSIDLLQAHVSHPQLDLAMPLTLHTMRDLQKDIESCCYVSQQHVVCIKVAAGVAMTCSSI